MLLVAAVAAARAVVTLALALGFWAAAPVALGWLPTTVMTASMTPAIEVGDVVVSRPMPADALLPGGWCWPRTLTGPTGCGCTASRGSTPTGR